MRSRRSESGATLKPVCLIEDDAVFFEESLANQPMQELVEEDTPNENRGECSEGDLAHWRCGVGGEEREREREREGA